MGNRPFEKEAESLGYKEWARSKESSHTVYLKDGIFLSAYINSDGAVGGKLECLLGDAIMVTMPNFPLPNKKFGEYESRIIAVKNACIAAGLKVEGLDD